MVFYLFIGLIGIASVLIFRNSLIEKVSIEYKTLQKLHGAKWFQNPWIAGLALFLVNAVLFSFVVLTFILLAYFRIPFIHLIVALLAVIISIFLWMLVSKSWEGTKASRLKMGFVGSSFYLLLLLVFVYMLMTLQPSYLGDDTFMASIGLMMGIIVTIVAFITCFIITGFSKLKPNGNGMGTEIGR